MRFPTVKFAPFVALLFAACGSTSPEDTEHSRKQHDLARELQKEGNIPGALQHANNALELDPANYEAHYLLGHIYLQRKNFAKAEEHLREGIRITSERKDLTSAHLEGRNMLGGLFMEQKRWQEAEAEFRASASDPMNHSPWLPWGNLGVALFQQERFAEAEEALLQGVRTQERFCFGYFWLAKTYRKLRQLEKAELAATQALTADEQCSGAVNQQSWRLRGEIRAERDDWQGAVDDLERCVELSPMSVEGKECQILLERRAQESDS